MVTDEQRHEVAEKLRAMSDEEGKWRTVAMRWLAVQVKPSELADFIEPSERTCHNDAIDGGFYCSACNHGVFDEDYRIAFEYCPNCGAKVVE